MSSPLKRKCEFCRFFADAGLAGNGWCTHPKRQVSSDVRLLVRKGELACRNSWGSDYWEAPSGANGGPVAPLLPSNLPVPAPKFEDQVTSVVNAEAGAAAVSLDATAAPPEDQVVAQGSVDAAPEHGASPVRRQRQSAHEVNAPAHADQHERARVMARGGAREAILRARERHRQRAGQPIRPDELPAVVESTPPSSDADQEQGTRPTNDDTADGTATPPSRAVPPPEDRVIQTHQRPARGAAIDPIRRSYNDTAPPVPASELPSDAEPVSGGGADRSRFDSVPKVRSDFVLPTLQPPTQRRPRPNGQPASIASGQTTHPAADEPERDTTSLEPVQYRQIKAAARAVRDSRPSRQSPRLSSPVDTDRRVALAADADRADVAADADSGFSGADAGTEPRWASDFPEGAPSRRSLTCSTSSEHRMTNPAAQSDLPAEPGEPLPRDARQGADDRSQGSRVSADATSAANGKEDLDDAEQSLRDLGEADYEPVSVRRRSWLTGLGRRQSQVREDTPQPVASFPLAAVSAPVRPMSSGPIAPGQAAVVAPHRHSDQDTSAEAAPPSPATEPGGASGMFVARARAVRPRAGETITTVAGPPRQRPSLASEIRLGPSDEGVGPAFDGRQGATAHPAPGAPNGGLGRSGSFQIVRSLSPRRESAEPQAQPISDDMAALRERLFGGDDRRPAPPMWDERQNAPPVRHVAVERPVSQRQLPEIVGATDEVVRGGTSLDIRDLVAGESEALNMEVEIAPQLPRICRTCRDFRPAENEERGWCTNEWAFTHRRMVNAEDRPCQTSIGTWWLPDDTVWLPDDALGAFDRPTPLMNAILVPPERRRVGER